MAIRNILVPTDFSPHAAKALDHAIEVARQYSAKVHLLHSYFFVDFQSPEAVPVPADFVENLRAWAQGELEGLQKRLSQAGVASEPHLSALNPISAILDVAKAVPADLIVMGTRGLTGLKHVLLGSVAERTVRMAPCPVMTVKAEDH